MQFMAEPGSVAKGEEWVLAANESFIVDDIRDWVQRQTGSEVRRCCSHTFTTLNLSQGAPQRHAGTCGGQVTDVTRVSHILNQYSATGCVCSIGLSRCICFARNHKPDLLSPLPLHSGLNWSVNGMSRQVSAGQLLADGHRCGRGLTTPTTVTGARSASPLSRWLAPSGIRSSSNLVSRRWEAFVWPCTQSGRSYQAVTSIRAMAATDVYPNPGPDCIREHGPR